MHTANEIASRFLGRSCGRLDERTQRVARHLAERKPISRNLPEELVTVATFGQRTTRPGRPRGRFGVHRRVLGGREIQHEQPGC